MRQIRNLTAVATTATAVGCGGNAVKNEVRPRPSGLRAMTFNIQSASRGLDGIADVIRAVSPDVVALQEVDRFSARANGLDQAAELASRTGLSHHQHFRATDLHGGAYGVALISRFPILEARQLMLPNRSGQEPRTAAIVRVDVLGAPVTVVVTHLSHLPTNGELRAAQSRRIVEELAGIDGPKLVMGDLNDGAGSGALRTLRNVLTDAFDTSGEGPDGTYPLPLFLPAIRLDYVLASDELKPLHSYVLRSEASDHYPLVAEFALETLGVPAMVAADEAL